MQFIKRNKQCRHDEESSNKNPRAMEMTRGFSIDSD